MCNGFTGYNETCRVSEWLLMETGIRNGICPKIHYRKPFLVVESWWFFMFVMVIVVETIIIFCNGFYCLFFQQGCDSCCFIKSKSAATNGIAGSTKQIPVAPDDILRFYEEKRLVCARNWTLFTTLPEIWFFPVNWFFQTVCFNELVQFTSLFSLSLNVECKANTEK